MLPLARLSLLALLLGAPLAAAQSALRLVDPVLTVDGRHVGTLGAPDGHGRLAIAVPGVGTYHVADQPFGGAARVGEFSGPLLVFAVQGTSVRLVSRETIHERGTAPAYVAFHPASARAERGPARLAFASTADRWAPGGPSAPAPRTGAEEARLRAEIERLAAERDRLARGLAPRDARLDSRDALAAERDRLLSERAQLLAERDRALAGRAELAARLVAVRAELDASRGVTRPRAAAQADDLRARIVATDAGLDALRAESADRAARLRSVESELASTRRALADAVAARDAAWAERDRLMLERDRLAAERDAALRERDVVLAEFEARLRSDAGWQAAPRAGDPVRRLAAEREALRAERDALALQLDALRAERDRLAADRSAAPAYVPPPTAAPVTEAPSRDGSFVYLPGFDFTRLRNADTIRRRLDTAAYPAWASAGRLEGDVLVLFQTDGTGRVIRTAVPTPLGGGLDALAEDLVREMRFVPPVVGGMPTGLRSQVLVRFER